MATKMKVGSKVNIKRRTGTIQAGKIADIVDTKRGLWFHVNVAEARKPLEIVKVRAAQIVG